MEQALTWLKSNNPAYADITINKSRLEPLSDNELVDIGTVEINDYVSVSDKLVLEMLMKTNSGGWSFRSGRKKWFETLLDKIMDTCLVGKYVGISWPTQGNILLS